MADDTADFLAEVDAEITRPTQCRMCVWLRANPEAAPIIGGVVAAIKRGEAQYEAARRVAVRHWPDFPKADSWRRHARGICRGR